MIFKQLKTDFTSGILSFGLYGRVDLEIFSKGLSDAINCRIGALGGVENKTLKLEKVSTFNIEDTTGDPNNRFAIRNPDGTYTIKTGTIENNGKVYRGMVNAHSGANQVHSIDSSGAWALESDCPSREVHRPTLTGARNFRYDPRDLYFSIEKIDAQVPLQISVANGLGKYIGEGTFKVGETNKTFLKYKIITPPYFDTVFINGSGDRVVNTHVIDEGGIEIIIPTQETFNKLAMYKNRLVALSGTTRKNMILFSCSDDIWNFENNENQSGEAIRYTFQEAQEIYNAFEFKSLLLFTSQGIWSLDRNQTLTPLNIPFDEVLAVPPARYISPAKVGNKIFTVNKSLNRIFMMEYVNNTEMTGFKTLDTTTPIEQELENINFICPVQVNENDGYSLLYVQTPTQSWIYTILSEEQIQHWTKIDTNFDFIHYQFFGDDILYFRRNGDVVKIKQVTTDTTKITLLKPFGMIPSNKGDNSIAFSKSYKILGMKLMVRGKYKIEVGLEGKNRNKATTFTWKDEDDKNSDGTLKTSVFKNEVKQPITVGRNRFSSGFTDVRLLEIDHLTAYYDDDVYIKILTTNPVTILGIELKLDVDTTGGI